MSDAQLEVLHRLNVAFKERADWVVFYEPDVEFHMPVEWPEDPVYRGADGLHKVVQLWTENFDEYHWEERKLIEVPPDRVVGLYNQAGRIKGTDTRIEHERGAVYTVREGIVVRYEEHLDLAAALEAAGVWE